MGGVWGAGGPTVAEAADEAGKQSPGPAPPVPQPLPYGGGRRPQNRAVQKYDISDDGDREECQAAIPPGTSSSQSFLPPSLLPFPAPPPTPPQRPSLHLLSFPPYLPPPYLTFLPSFLPCSLPPSVPSFLPSFSPYLPPSIPLSFLPSFPAIIQPNLPPASFLPAFFTPSLSPLSFLIPPYPSFQITTLLPCLLSSSSPLITTQAALGRAPEPEEGRVNHQLVRVVAQDPKLVIGGQVESRTEQYIAGASEKQQQHAHQHACARRLGQPTQRDQVQSLASVRWRDKSFS